MTTMRYIESDFVDEHESLLACGRRIRPLSWRDRVTAWITASALVAWVGVRLHIHRH